MLQGQYRKYKVNIDFNYLLMRLLNGVLMPLNID